mmetsp:Transcript_86031/g.228671  ORF Transcript_86031/g.228671 Transcript_86031/m.228671 type:complete len:200 (+) Transcript_86031:174-773(+)
MVAHVQVVGAISLIEGDNHRGQPLPNRCAVVGGQRAWRPRTSCAHLDAGRDLVQRGVRPNIQVVGAITLVVRLHKRRHPPIGARLIPAPLAQLQVSKANCRILADHPLHGLAGQVPFQLPLLLRRALQLELALHEPLVLDLQLLRPSSLEVPVLLLQSSLLLHEELLTPLALLELRLQRIVVLAQSRGLVARQVGRLGC